MKQLVLIMALFGVILVGCECLSCGQNHATEDNRKLVIKVPDGKGYYFVYEFMRKDVVDSYTGDAMYRITTKNKTFRFYGNFILEEDR